MMKLTQIDLLVVGLPVALFAGRKAALEQAMTGRHDIGEGRSVTVAKVLAFAQPQGALVHYASVHGKLTEIGTERSLIVDPGSRTFDWLVSQGMRSVPKQRHSVNRGASDVLRLLAQEISHDIGTPYRDQQKESRPDTGRDRCRIEGPADGERGRPRCRSARRHWQNLGSD